MIKLEKEVESMVDRSFDNFLIGVLYDEQHKEMLRGCIHICKQRIIEYINDKCDNCGGLL